jgi:hypothetical protein
MRCADGVHKGFAVMSEWAFRMRLLLAFGLRLARTINPHLAANKQFSVTFSVFARG